MAWIESHDTLRDHPKLDLLLDVLGLTRRDAVGLLHLIWWRALTYANDGDLSGLTDGQIARWAEWEGDAAQLVTGLTTAGFLDEDRRLHDWYDYAGRWVERRRANAERMKKARAPSVQNTSGARAGATGPNRTGPDLTGPDPSPQPPPQADGGGAADAADGTQDDGASTPLLDDGGSAAGGSTETHVTSGAPVGPNQPRARRQAKAEPNGEIHDLLSPPEAVLIWRRALGELRLAMSQANFTNYLDGTAGLSLDADTLVVGVSNPLVRDTLEQRFKPHILRSLYDVAGRPMAVQLVATAVPNGSVFELDQKARAP